MKNLLIALCLLSSSAAFAGPEDHLYDSCYSATTKVPSFLYSTLCFETVALDRSINMLLFSGYASNVPSTAKIISINRINENYFNFTAKSILIDHRETDCGYAEYAELIISGQSDLDGKIGPKSLHFSVNFTLTNDSCHSHPAPEKIEYKLSK